MSRAERILERFPAHFEAARPGKLLGEVVAALARDLDVQSAQLAGIRRAHRVREADTTGDLMRLAALHGIRPGEVDILFLRLARAAERASALAAADPAERPAHIEALLALWALDLPEDRLGIFTPAPAPDAPAPSAEEAEAEALAILLAAAEAATGYRARRRALSDRIVRICRNHAQGNATVRAMLEGAATALDLDVLATFHSEDRYLHAAETRDRLTLVPVGVAPPAQRTEVLGLEENPIRRAEQPPSERRHGELFEIQRKGFDPARLEIRITPEDGRGVGPMVVNRDQGRGVGYAGTIPPGETLVFSETGRATIGTSDVTAFAYGFEGAVFADAGSPAGSDAAFDATNFAVATPAGALDREFTFPHAGSSVPMPEVAIGSTRMAFFVQEGHFGLAADPPGRPAAVTTTPRPTAGLFAGPGAPLGSVFAPGPDEARTPAALVAFAWREHEAYKVRVHVPRRFRQLSDDPEGVEVARRVTGALERFRPAGIAVETVFIDDRWVLGQGVLAGEETETGALLALSGGTVLWPAPDETDPPGQNG
jgi:hypothetical protein